MKPEWLIYCGFAVTLFVLSANNVRHLVLPDKITIPAILAGLLASWLFPSLHGESDNWLSLIASAAGAIAGSGSSRNFVESYLREVKFKVRCAHILEMVGYASSAPGSQRVPTGLPITISDKGDFLGLLANGRSTACMDSALKHAGAYVPELPVTGLNVKLGLEKYLPVLSRSDHAPFWTADIPAVMWTDTSEFRNHNYHRPTDTPDTLDYQFLRRVTQLLTASVLAQAREILDCDD